MNVVPRDSPRHGCVQDRVAERGDGACVVDDMLVWDELAITVL